MSNEDLSDKSKLIIKSVFSLYLNINFQLNAVTQGWNNAWTKVKNIIINFNYMHLSNKKRSYILEIFQKKAMAFSTVANFTIIA